MDWQRYTGVVRREVARRPIGAIVREKERLALQEMTCRAPISVGVDWASGPDWTVTKLTPGPSFGRFRRQIAEADEEIVKAIGGRAPTAQVTPLPVLAVGMRVRCLDVDCPEIFGEEAEVTRVHETGAFSVRSDRGPDAWTASSCSSWLRTVFPCDASRLRPSVGMHVSLALDERNTFVEEMVRVETGELLVIEGVWQFCEGVVDSESRHRFVFSKEHWLRRVWPDRLRGQA